MTTTFFQEFPLVDYNIAGIRHRITNINVAYTLLTNKLSNLIPCLSIKGQATLS